MAEINDEMRVTADYAISTAKERYGLDLDFSEESLAVLDNILEKIYWGFSGHSKDEGEGGLIYNSAIIWGSYLGEYMRLKWGGTWLLKGTERRVSITSIEFSPINFIFQRITNHPEYSVKNFIQEAKNVIYASVIHPQKQPQFVAEPVVQVKKPAPVKPARKPIHLDKRVVYITGGVLGLLIVVTASLAGYAMISGNGSIPDASNTPTLTMQPTQIDTAVVLDTSDTPTVTQLPTYTPVPSKTPRPSRTPLFTITFAPSGTPTETFTPTETPTEYIQPTRTRTRTPTQQPPSNTFTPTPTLSPSKTPTPSNTPPPSPTYTFTIVPPRILSCGVSPSSFPAGPSIELTFKVDFSVAGNYNISVPNLDPNPPGAQGCSGNSGGGSSAECKGQSGLLGSGQSVNVTIYTDLGNCSVSYLGQ